MHKELQVALEGPHADEAFAELLSIEGLVGQAKQPEPSGEENTRDGGVLVVIGSIVAIASGVVTIADKILAWREKCKARRLSVVIEDARGNRLPLENATPEEIIQVLKSLSH